MRLHTSIVVAIILLWLIPGCELDLYAGAGLQMSVLASREVGPVVSVFGEREAEDYLLELINAERERFGVEPLMMDEALRRAARSHSEEMAALEYFSHASPTKGLESCRHRVARHGITEAEIGENLARIHTRRLPDWSRLIMRAHRGLMASPGHRANLLRPSFNYAGIGVVKEYRDGRFNLYITENFATRLFELEEIAVESTENDLIRVVVSGRQPAEGYASLQVDRSQYDWVALEPDDEGRFSVIVELEAGSGRRLLSLGLGAERLGHRRLANEWFIDTDPPGARLFLPVEIAHY